MPKLNGVQSGRLLTFVCVLLSAHFAMDYNTLTKVMVPFIPEKGMNVDGGPFAYRMLPVLLWKVCVFVLGPVHRYVPDVRFPDLNKPLSSNEDWFMVLLTFVAMLGTLAVARRLLRTIDQRPGFEWMALGIGYAAYFDTMLVLNRNLFYPYDVLALFFFTLLVSLAYRGRPIAFTLTLMAAMVNKETAIMSVLVYFGLWYGRRTLMGLAATCGGMGSLAIGVRVAQTAYVRHFCVSCHAMSEHHLLENAQQFANPLFWLSELSVFGFAYVAAIVFWRYVPPTVQATAVGVYGLWVVGMMVVGIMREVRIFSELSALLLLVVALGVHGWLERRPVELNITETVILNGSQV